MNIELFETKFRVDENGCWIFTNVPLVTGYGQISWRTNGKQKNHRAHRVSWELYRGPIPEGMHVCHKCDVRLCVNPDHLFLGTRKDNMQDCSRKGRLRMQRVTHCPKGHPYSGENLRVMKGGGRGCHKCHRDAAISQRFYKKEHNEMVAQYGFGERM